MTGVMQMERLHFLAKWDAKKGRDITLYASAQVLTREWATFECIRAEVKENTDLTDLRK